MLQVQNVFFSYSDKQILSNITFTLEKGISMAVIGESGCGKSTLLKLIYGLYDLDKGKISWDETKVLGPKFHLIPGMSFMKYLAQDFDLMPYISVAENVGKYLSNFYPEQKSTRVAELLDIVEMTEFSGVKAQYLSGGQMQRVAIARVLALEPEVLLLDEPFSHIDNFRKNNLRRKLFRYLKEKNITTIVATHDSTDVLSFTDEVLVMQEGSIIQFGTAKSIYDMPKNYYVASLFGDVNKMEMDKKIRFVYPHQLKIVDHSDIPATVLKSYFRGSFYLIEAQYQGSILYFESLHLLENGMFIYLSVE